MSVFILIHLSETIMWCTLKNVNPIYLNCFDSFDPMALSNLLYVTHVPGPKFTSGLCLVIMLEFILDLIYINGFVLILYCKLIILCEIKTTSVIDTLQRCIGSLGQIMFVFKIIML